MNTVQYRVTIQEHDCTPWTAGVWPDRAGAWHRVLLAARHIEADWPHPVFVRIYSITNGIERMVYKADARSLRATPAT